jgi:hemerythrin-like domain-containing protein
LFKRQDDLLASLVNQMEQKNILNLMIAHHALLNALFILFRDQALEKSVKTSSSLSELTWETSKHFFVEEKAVFDFVVMGNFGVLSMMNQLKDEHTIMLNDLKRFSEDPSKVTKEDLENFFNLMEVHRELEEEKLYPKIDKELLEQQKKKIIERINEFPLPKK